MHVQCMEGCRNPDMLPAECINRLIWMPHLSEISITIENNKQNDETCYCYACYVMFSSDKLNDITLSFSSNMLMISMLREKNDV